MEKNKTFWLQLLPSQRRQIRDEKNLTNFQEYVEELTGKPLNLQVNAESNYLQSENGIVNMRNSRNDTILYTISPVNYCMLYKYAKQLNPKFHDKLTIMNYKDLETVANNYMQNPPIPRARQLTFDQEYLIVTMAMENVLWGTPHILAAMQNLGYKDIKIGQVSNCLKRNNIPNTMIRRNKGIQWEYFLCNLEYSLKDDSLDIYDIETSDTADNPYRTHHNKLINFYRNATIDSEELALNKYLRYENIVLQGIYYQKNKKLRLTSDEKLKLAKSAQNLTGHYKEQVSLMSPREIILYTNKKASSKHCSPCPEFPKKKEIVPKSYLTEIIQSIIKENSFVNRKLIHDKVNAFLGKKIARKRIYNILQELNFFTEKPPINGIPWRKFKSQFRNITWAGDFFSINVWSNSGIVTYQVLFFVHLGTGKVFIAGSSHEPTSEWVIQRIKGWTDGFNNPFGDDARFLIRDCDRRYTKEVDWYFTAIGLIPKKTTPYAPVMNCEAEIFVRQIKYECLNHQFILSHNQLCNILKIYQDYYNTQRPNSKSQGRCILENDTHNRSEGKIVSHSLLPGVLNYYYRAEEKAA